MCVLLSFIPFVLVYDLLHSSSFAFACSPVGLGITVNLLENGGAPSSWSINEDLAYLHSFPSLIMQTNIAAAAIYNVLNAHNNTFDGLAC